MVIVKDEFTTRRALVNMVKWEEMGFRVDGEFADGQELFSYLKSNTPDVILTDIRMTTVGGIEIARRIAEENLPVKVVFLSAYRDFAYAQEAVEYNVTHYLLKPIDLSKLREVFHKLKETLDKEEIMESLSAARKEHYGRLVNYERQQFVTDAYFGALTSPNSKAKRLNLVSSDSEKESRLVLAKVVLNNKNEVNDYSANFGQQELQDEVERVLGDFDENLEYYPITWGVLNGENLFLLGVFWENEKRDAPGVTPLALTETILKRMSLSVEVPVFEVLESTSALINYAGVNSSHLTEENNEKNFEYLYLLHEQNKLLCSYLKQNSLELGLKLTESLFDNYFTGGIGFAKRQSFYTVTKLLDEVAGAELLLRNRLFSACVPASFFTAVDYAALKEWLTSGVRLLFEAAAQKNEVRTDTSIDKIKEYLKSHYNEDISLTKMAEELFLNPTYISRLVKEQTGKNYTELVMQMRIEKAVELIKHTDLFIYEIASRWAIRISSTFIRYSSGSTEKRPAITDPKETARKAERKECIRWPQRWGEWAFWREFRTGIFRSCFLRTGCLFLRALLCR